jgi:hypothetical protein
MKKLISGAFLLLLFIGAGAQNNSKYPYSNSYHFIYVDLYGGESKVDVKNKIEELLNNIQKSRDSFLLYISNGENAIIITDYRSINKDLYNNIIAIYAALPSYSFDIKNIVDIWNKNDFMFTNNGKQSFKYSHIYFHYFISISTLKNYHDYVIDRLLKVNNISGNFSNTKDVIVNIYRNPNWPENKFLESQKLIKTNLGDEYTINYVSY